MPISKFITQTQYFIYILSEIKIQETNDICEEYILTELRASDSDVAYIFLYKTFIFSSFLSPPKILPFPAPTVTFFLAIILFLINIYF